MWILIGSLIFIIVCLFILARKIKEQTWKRAVDVANIVAAIAAIIAIFISTNPSYFALSPINNQLTLTAAKTTNGSNSFSNKETSPTPLPIYTDPVVVSPTFEPNREPTVKPTDTILVWTATLTSSPTPTSTITFTPTPAQEILIENRFSEGRSPAWNVFGEPVIINGAITWDGSNPVILSVGDSSWKNYRIMASFPHFDTGSCDFFLGVRVQDDGRMIALGVVRAARLGWFKRQGSSNEWISQNEALITDQPAYLDVIVNGDNYNWVGGVNMNVPGYESGGVSIYLTCDTMDYIKVIKLP